MRTLNHTLEKYFIEADGCYLDSQKLQPFEQYMQSYSARIKTYQNMRDQSANLVLQALRKLAQVHPELIQQHGKRCQYDMTEVLRYIALSILRDDEIFFKEQMMVWLDTILLAHKKTTHCAKAYRYLQDAISAALPPADSSLIRPYLDYVVLTLDSHA